MTELNLDELRPTHHCFDDAIDIVVGELKVGNEEALHCLIVHAVCLTPWDEPYAHAWMEDPDGFSYHGYMKGDELVYLRATPGDLEKFYRPQRCVKYTLAQWRNENERTGYYGPWDPEIWALALKPDKRIWNQQGVVVITPDDK
jgi:hypothetical protein